jgi:hypothetical protein
MDDLSQEQQMRSLEEDLKGALSRSLRSQEANRSSNLAAGRQGGPANGTTNQSSANLIDQKSQVYSVNETPRRLADEGFNPPLVKWDPHSFKVPGSAAIFSGLPKEQRAAFDPPFVDSNKIIRNVVEPEKSQFVPSYMQPTRSRPEDIERQVDELRKYKISR